MQRTCRLVARQRVFSHVLLSFAIASSWAAARGQTANLFEFFPDTNGTAVSFASRLTLGTDAGEISCRYASTLWQHVADARDAGGSSTLVGYQGAHQDQDAATTESLWVVVRRLAASGSPDPSNAGRLVRTGPIAMPSGGRGPKAWLLTVTFPEIAVPHDAGWSFGLEVQSAPKWPADGLTAHVAHYSIGSRGDHPRPAAPNHCFAIVPTRTPPVEQPSPRTLRLGVLTSAALLQVGMRDAGNRRQLPVGSANYGAGGTYPDVSGINAGRADDVTLRVRDRANAAGITVVWASPTRLGVRLGIPGFRGSFRLGLPFALDLATPLDAQGHAEIVLSLGSPTAPIRRVLRGQSVHWQGLSFDFALTRFSFTNLATQSL